MIFHRKKKKRRPKPPKRHRMIYHDEILNDSPVSYWRCNDNILAADAHQFGDLSGRGADLINYIYGNGGGSDYSGYSYAVAGAVLGSAAVQLDGVYDTPAVGPWLSGTTTAVLTVELWCNWGAFANDDKYLMEYTYDAFATYDGFRMEPNNSTYSAFLFGTKGWTDSFTRPSAGWHHYVFVVDRSTPVNRAYVDGTLQTLTARTHTGTAGGNWAGGDSLFLCNHAVASNLCPANTAVQEIAIYPYALSQAQITHHYQVGTDPTLGTVGLASGMIL